MNNQEIIHHLTTLAAIDIQSYKTLTFAINHIKDKDIKDQLSEFREDHRQHLLDLSHFIKEYGGSPLQIDTLTNGLNGELILNISLETDSILRTLRSNENFTNKKYLEATVWTTNPEIMNIIEQNQEDEQAHLHYIESMLSLRKKAA